MRISHRSLRWPSPGGSHRAPARPPARRLGLEPLEERALLGIVAGWDQNSAGAPLPATQWNDVDGGGLGDAGDIHGIKWHDLDGSGTREPQEPGLAGWTIYLDANRNGRLDENEQSTVTDLQGNYQLTTTASDGQMVAEVLPDGWRQTSPGPDAWLTDARSRQLDTSGALGLSVYDATAESVADGLFGVDLVFEVEWSSTVWSLLPDTTTFSIKDGNILVDLYGGPPFVGPADVWQQYETVHLDGLSPGSYSVLATLHEAVGGPLPAFRTTWEAEALLVASLAGAHVTSSDGSDQAGYDFGNQSTLAPTLAVHDSASVEGHDGNRSMDFLVSLSLPAQDEVTVDFETRDGTATAGRDYETTRGTLAFAPGEQVKRVRVPLVGDAEQEPDEAFAVVLSSPSLTGALLRSGSGAILDDDAPRPSQIVAGASAAMPFAADHALLVQAVYDTSRGNTALSGLGLRIHYDSSAVRFDRLVSVFEPGFLQQDGPLDDTADFDGDPRTDKYVLVAWADAIGNWPGEPLPVDLVTARFQPQAGLPVGTATVIRFSASSTAISHDFLPAPVKLVAAPWIDLDVDGNGRADALSDGIVVLRYLFGFTGDALVEGAVDPNGNRTAPEEITAYLNGGRITMLDVDDNGRADALSDGIVVLRYLFGFTGGALVEDAVDPAGHRTDADEIRLFLHGFNPNADVRSPLAAAASPTTGGEDLDAANEANPFGEQRDGHLFDPALFGTFAPTMRSTAHPPSIPDRSRIHDPRYLDWLVSAAAEENTVGATDSHLPWTGEPEGVLADARLERSLRDRFRAAPERLLDPLRCEVAADVIYRLAENWLTPPGMSD